MTANDFIDWELKAVKPVVRYTSYKKAGVPEPIMVDVKNESQYVGKIYSWVTDDSGNVWWQLYETYKPGASMFVKHDPSGLLPVAPAGTKIEVDAPGFLTDFAKAASTSASGFIIPILLLIGGIVWLSKSK